MNKPLLVRDIMRIGVPTCKLEDTVEHVATLMLDQGATALVVLDEDADTRGWINEARLASVYRQMVEAREAGERLEMTAADILDEDVPEAPSDILLTDAAQIMADSQVDHLFFLHRAGGRSWPASLLSLRDLVKAMAGPEYYRDQGHLAARPTPMDLFRQRHGLPKK